MAIHCSLLNGNKDWRLSLCVSMARAARVRAQLCARREHSAKMVYDTQNIKYNTIGLICSRKVTCGVVNNLLTLEYVTLWSMSLSDGLNLCCSLSLCYYSGPALVAVRGNFVGTNLCLSLYLYL